MIKKLINKSNKLLWSNDLQQSSKLQVFFIQTLRILYAAARDLNGGLPSLRAMGLVYTTLLSIVPLLAVSFSVLKGFGVHNQLEPTLINLLEPLGEKGLQISENIIGFVDNMQVGVLGSLGLLLLIFTVLSLVKKIETAFNATWRIKSSRNILQRFSDYLSVILIGPLLLFTAAGINASFNNSDVISKVAQIEPFGTMLLIVGEIIPYLLTIITFTLIYILIPNTKVKFSSALYGGVITMLLWKVTGIVFKGFIVDSTNYTAIYSSFAIIIIFMIWIYLSWLIVLTGASISYYHQNPDRITNSSLVICLSCRLREKIALAIMQLIATSFFNNDSMWTTASLSKKIKISETAVCLVISALLSKKLITTTGDNNQYYLPQLSIDKITVDMILNAVRSAEESPTLQLNDVITSVKIDTAIASVEQAISDSSKNTTLKDLL